MRYSYHDALHNTKHTLSRHTTHYLLIIVCILVSIGLLFIYSASSVFALKTYHYAHYFVAKQAIGVILMLLCGRCLHQISIGTVIVYAHYISYAILIIMFLSLAIGNYGTTIHGSTRWISIGGIAGQPVEFLKIFLIPALAASITRSMAYSMRPLHGILQLSPLLMSTIIILLIQPDFGQSVLLIITTLFMLLIAYQTVTYLCYTTAISLTIATALIIGKPYRLRRLLTFLSPWDDPQGAGFQIVQSLIAIGSGGIAGIGIGNSQQKFFYLPMQHTDFIFSIIGEETGIIGTTLILMLYGALTYQGFKIALRTTDTATMLTVAGYTAMITGQTMINLAVTTGLAPTKGIGLPFISYGLSSLIAHGCIIGLMLSAEQSS